MSASGNPDFDRILDELFRAYRKSYSDPEPGPNFMPALWRAIDSRRSFSLAFGRWARGFVTAAAALAMVMAILVAIPSRQISPVYMATYLDVLVDDTRTDNPAYIEVVRHDSAWESNVQ